ncbi:MAG: glycoside hydrolase family 32 protein [Oscillospiraceae bacterium]|nr:glycoside hydrolase family 32 protein [Oscillospiraceae bacterium]
MQPIRGNPLYAELWRPAYHYTAKNSWLNDPNGLVYFKGTYHIYYQTNPGKNYRGAEHWGHAVSEDLVHFTEHEPVLSPDESGNIWSGTAYADEENRSGLFNGVPGGGIIAAYSTHRQQIGLAYSVDGFRYEKIGIVIANTDIDHFRDPKFFFDALSGKWTMVIAGGKVRFYQSLDLRNWECVSENEIYTECPDFFPLPVEGTDTVKWVLTCAGRYCYVGSWDGRNYTVESDQIPLNFGPEAYAGITFQNDKLGRVLMLSWLNSWDSTQPADGIWCSALSLVSQLKLRRFGSTYRIMQQPAREYDALRRKPLIDEQNLAVERDNPLGDVCSQTYILEMDVDLSQNKDFELNVCEGTQERVSLKYEAESRTLIFDRSKNVLGIPSLHVNSPVHRIALDERYIHDDVLKLLLYVDTACYELYACDGAYLFTGRIQPLPFSRGASIRAEEGLRIRRLCVTPMENIHFPKDATINSALMQESPITTVITDRDGVFRYVSDFRGEDDFTVGSLDPVVAVAEKVPCGIRVRGITPGVTQVRIATAGSELLLPVKVLEKDNFASQLNSFSMINATLEKTYQGYDMVCGGGDGFALSSVYATEFSYAAELTLVKNVGTAALLFRVQNLRNFYCLSADVLSGSIRLWMKDRGVIRDLYSVGYDLVDSGTYHFRVEARQDTFEVFVNGERLFCVVDTAHRGGLLGLHLFNGEACFNNITYSVPENRSVELAFSSFRTVVGNVARTPEGWFLHCEHGDGFAIADVPLRDFTYSADILLTKNTPGCALVFRRVDAGNFYCATVDVVAQTVKLWKKVGNSVFVVREVPAKVTPDMAHCLKVKACGSAIQVWFSDELKIDMTDTSHMEGTLGLNVFCGSAYFQRVHYCVLQTDCRNNEEKQVGRDSLGSQG